MTPTLQKQLKGLMYREVTVKENTIEHVVAHTQTEQNGSSGGGIAHDARRVGHAPPAMREAFFNIDIVRWREIRGRDRAVCPQLAQCRL
ncbi:hypothetical protein EVAR_61050_1 [Eumeta japonica]|uniref:Uncharacterized protein n=1 Tax=Eumeta variegata TaxID=151549 RepID=A0A4C1Z3L8_EUMVA|nr:hypothetical protein EVAR_61050_1 [Eumeta japonica]